MRVCLLRTMAASAQSSHLQSLPPVTNGPNCRSILRFSECVGGNPITAPRRATPRFYEILFTPSAHLHGSPIDSYFVESRLFWPAPTSCPVLSASLCHLSFFFLLLSVRPPSPPQSHHKLDGRQLSELSEDSLTAITRCVGIHVETPCPALLPDGCLSRSENNIRRWKEKRSEKAKRVSQR